MFQLAQAVELLFDRLDSMNGACINRFASWFAYHLSNFQFRWNWDDWSVVLKQEALQPKPKFMAEAMQYMTMLSYHQKVLENIPSTFHRLAPPLWAPKNKFVAKRTIEDLGGGGDDENEAQPMQVDEVPLDDDQMPGAGIAAKVMAALKERASTDQMVDILADIGGEQLRVDVFVTSLLNFSSKSMTHTFAAIARYQPVLKSLNETEQAQVAILNAIAEVWSSHQLVSLDIINKR